jgi:hypothetical protein
MLLLPRKFCHHTDICAGVKLKVNLVTIYVLKAKVNASNKCVSMCCVYTDGSTVFTICRSRQWGDSCVVSYEAEYVHHKEKRDRLLVNRPASPLTRSVCDFSGPLKAADSIFQDTNNRIHTSECFHSGSFLISSKITVRMSQRV